MNIKDFFSKEKHGGKGFAAAVFACLLIVAGAGVYSYSKISNKLSDKLIEGNSAASVPRAESKAAEAPGTSVPKPVTEPPVYTTPAPVPETVPADEPAKEADVTAGAIPIDEPASVQAMVRPLNGEVLNSFSDGELVKSATLNVWKTHDGVDISGAEGEKVKSMTSGTVEEVYEDQMMGVCVLIDHGSGLEGYYCSLSADVPVTEGQTVSAGTVIGTVGDTADAELKEGTHLHFALKKNGEWIDPIALISGEGS